MGRSSRRTCASHLGRVGAFSAALALALAACGDSGETTDVASPEGEAAADSAAAPATPLARPEFAGVDAARLVNADAEPGQWMSTGRDYYEQHYSPLDQINTDNIGELGLAWFVDIDTNQNQEATPLFVDGVLYVSTAWSKVYAIGARSGQTLWQYDPEVPGQWQQNICCGVVNRGVAAWNGKIYVGTLDGRLVALDAKTGAEVFDIQATDPNQRYSITGAPRVAGGKVLIGQAGSEFGVRGYLAAYDAETGEEAWRFYTVPGNPADGFENEAMEMAAQTWEGEWWSTGSGAGGTVWDGIAYDPVTNNVFFGTGNGTPWNEALRGDGGDHLFLASILAVDPDTGEYRWHHQNTPEESWDYDANAPMMIADLEIDGQMRHVVMHAPKNGFFYVYDAETGEVISAKNFVPQNWALSMDENGRPEINPEAQYPTPEDIAWVTPGPAGGHSWHPMAYSPQTGLVYIPARYSSWAFQQQADYEETDVGVNTALDMGANGRLADQMPEELRYEQGGSVMAWDPVKGEVVWEFKHMHQGPNGGLLATAGGLVFQGNAGGPEFAAYDARSGARLWTFPTQTGVAAAPISYELDGEQYIAVVPGRAAQDYYAPNYSRVLVFKRDGGAVLPEPVEYVSAPINPVEQFASQEAIDHGASLFSQNCAGCHGDGGQSRATFPDLRRSVRLGSQAAFDSVVLEGALAENGMASFAAGLDGEDTQALRAYVVSLAQDALSREAEGAGPGQGQPPAAGPAAVQVARDDADAAEAAEETDEPAPEEDTPGLHGD
jgi:PQQ-dependent dehydrogenase (methanol/ethanol family)